MGTVDEHDCPTREEFISLREYFERILVETDRRYEQRFIAQQNALETAKQVAQRWRDAAETWHRDADKRDRKYLTQESFDAQHANVQRQVDDLSTLVHDNIGRGVGQASTWSYLIAAGGVIVAIVSLTAGLIIHLRTAP